MVSTMGMYFNEHDAFAAAWLRELWPDATIDSRSIVDVSVADVSGFDRAHFFGGIGGWQYALELAGWDSTRPVWTGSCPCQPFSVAGKGRGTDDERHLWPEMRRLIGECRPPVIFGEQVASAAGREWLAGVRADLEALGYAIGAADLCAAGVGAPHLRQRLYWVAQSDYAERGQVGIDRQDVVNGRNAGRPETHREPRARCEVCGVAVAGHERQGRGVHGPGEGAHADGSGASSELGGSSSSRGVAYCDGEGCGECGERHSDTSAGESASRGNDACRCREAGGMEYPSSRGLGIDGRAPGNAGHSDEPEQADGLGDSDDPRSQGRGLDPREHADERAPWSSMSTVPCADGKARRVEPSIQPLVAGLPKAMVRGRDPREPFDANATAEARVGRLRGYGNAIVPQLAATFIRAFLEAIV